MTDAIGCKKGRGNLVLDSKDRHVRLPKASITQKIDQDAWM